MAHFAKIENNFVTQVVVVNNEVLKDENGIEQESIGSQFCSDLFSGTWIQTSYNNNFRGRFAGIGHTYNDVFDAFIQPKCHDEAVLDEATYEWVCANAEHAIRPTDSNLE